VYAARRPAGPPRSWQPGIRSLDRIGTAP
jgi:hypothetical protein